MNIAYTDRLDGIAPTQIEGFFQGWPNGPSPDAHLKILRGSYRCWLAMDGEQVVGFINAISDGVYYAHIPLLEVLPNYRGRGIGKELVQRMHESLKDFYAIDIVCDEDLEAFYAQCGFTRWTAMIRRNYSRQNLKGEPDGIDGNANESA